MAFDNNFSVTWHEEGKPRFTRVYLVAVRYPNGFGVYDFAMWNGEEWDLGYTGTVVGWVSTDDIVNSLEVGWPEKDQEIDKEFEKRYLERKKQEALQGTPDDEEDNWIELE